MSTRTSSFISFSCTFQFILSAGMAMKLVTKICPHERKWPPGPCHVKQRAVMLLTRNWPSSILVVLIFLTTKSNILPISNIYIWSACLHDTDKLHILCDDSLVYITEINCLARFKCTVCWWVTCNYDAKLIFECKTSSYLSINLLAVYVLLWRPEEA